MTEEELIKKIVKRLKINVEFKEAGRAYWCGDHELTVYLELDGKVISKDSCYIPNKDQESAY